MIGIGTASTISTTTTPIVRISAGSSSPVRNSVVPRPAPRVPAWWRHQSMRFLRLICGRA
ncbi:hypothetical protein RSPO_c00365 [Ralstonia solanacearum Po82]|uniref:Uncharacterized protein n=1 Tax=Ralstonia solanacearum (strain Po82) TaxID=1031711 RepID=F6G6X4_RALS8|nr:hypothetical protein RSPO_c00365 [Ralstonia solanacearum Po82]